MQETHPQKSLMLATVVVCLLILAGVLYVLLEHKTPSGSTSQTATSTLDTYGMNEYTDTAHAFSFWYPSTMQVVASATSDSTEFPGGTAVETLQVGPLGGTSIVVVDSPTGAITDEPSNHASPINQTKYFYDSASGEWMVTFPQGTDSGSSSATTTADTSKTTMGGLVMLPSGRRFDTTIIPLTTTEFLVVSDGGGSAFTNQLAETITQSSSSVNASTEMVALEAEATAASE